VERTGNNHNHISWTLAKQIKCGRKKTRNVETQASEAVIGVVGS
jgi:hypothetical protein